MAEPESQTKGPSKFAHLLVKNQEWRNRPIRILSAVGADKDPAIAAEKITEMLEAARIKADPEIVAAENTVEEMRRRSANATLVFMGFDLPEEGTEALFGAEMNALIEELENVVLVSSIGGGFPWWPDPNAGFTVQTVRFLNKRRRADGPGATRAGNLGDSTSTGYGFTGLAGTIGASQRGMEHWIPLSLPVGIGIIEENG